MKVLGCKVSDDVYKKITSLGPKSTVLRSAIDLYLDQHRNREVNLSKPHGSSQRHANEYKYIESELSALTDRFCEDLKKLMEANNER